jgi:hypothetical protein
MIAAVMSTSCFGFVLFRATILIAAQLQTREPLSTENLDSDVLVMQFADQGMRHDASDPLNRA